MTVSFRNSISGELRQVGVGRSWTLFLSACFLGVALFRRGLAAWGFLFLMLSMTDLAVSLFIDRGTDALSNLITCVALALAIWIGMKGNEMTAKNLLAHGWLMTEPRSEAARYAVQKWDLAPYSFD